MLYLGWITCRPLIGRRHRTIRVFSGLRPCSHCPRRSPPTTRSPSDHAIPRFQDNYPEHHVAGGTQYAYLDRPSCIYSPAMPVFVSTCPPHSSLPSANMRYSVHTSRTIASVFCLAAVIPLTSAAPTPSYASSEPIHPQTHEPPLDTVRRSNRDSLLVQRDVEVHNADKYVTSPFDF